MPTIELSDAALALFRRRLAGEWVEVTDQTQPLYRELVEAGMMTPLHSFTRGAEAPTASRRPPAANGRRVVRKSFPAPAPLHLPEQLPCRVADRQLRLGSGDQRELVIPAVLMFHQLVGDDSLRPVPDPGAPPELLSLLVIVRQEVRIHQAGIERDLSRARDGAPFAVTREEAVNLALAGVIAHADLRVGDAEVHHRLPGDDFEVFGVATAKIFRVLRGVGRRFHGRAPILVHRGDPPNRLNALSRRSAHVRGRRAGSAALPMTVMPMTFAVPDPVTSTSEPTGSTTINRDWKYALVLGRKLRWTLEAVVNDE